ncbi:MAG: hypothetical protein VX768_21755 [Planctomycetota bacterium]|nr:hypothetical protein [Planctomycetota bacterium]
MSMQSHDLFRPLFPEGAMGAICRYKACLLLLAMTGLAVPVASAGVGFPVMIPGQAESRQDPVADGIAADPPADTAEAKTGDVNSGNRDVKAVQQGSDEDVPNNQVELPWERKRENKIPRLTRLSERELLADVSDEELLAVQDHLAINLNQHLFAKLMFRVPQFGLDNATKLARENGDTTLEELSSESGFHRFKMFRIEGQARYWEKRQLVEEVGELFGFSTYFKIKIRSAGGENIILYCHSIPKRWKGSQQINEDVFFQGLFVNLTLSREKRPILNFVADRVGWTPRSPSALVSEKGHTLLGSVGFDLGLLDALKNRNKRRLDKEDTETFYQMLAAAKWVADSRNPPEWAEEIEPFDLIETLRAPGKHHGDLRILRAEIRNVTRIRVEKPYIRERLGISEYFQLDGFVRFDSSITYKGENGKKGAVFKDKYPICLCVNRLPKGWETGSGHRYTATFPTFFFKVWAYPSGYQSRFSKEALQQSPLLIGLDPVRYQQTRETTNWVTVGLYLLFGAGFIGIWTVYYLGQVKKERKETRFRLPGKVDDGQIPDRDSGNSDEGPVPGMPVIEESERKP